MNKYYLLFFYYFIITNKKMKCTHLLLFEIKETNFYCDEVDHVKLQNLLDNSIFTCKSFYVNQKYIYLPVIK